MTNVKYKAHRLREKVANELSSRDVPSGDILRLLDSWGMFNNWEPDEFFRRPVNMQELGNVVYEALRA